MLCRPLCSRLVAAWHLCASLQDAYRKAIVEVVMLLVKVGVFLQHLLQGVHSGCHKLDHNWPAAHGKRSRATQTNTVQIRSGAQVR